MVKEDVIDKNRQDKNFRRTNTFPKNETILLVTFGQLKNIWANLCSPPELFWSPTAMNELNMTKK